MTWKLLQTECLCQNVFAQIKFNVSLQCPLHISYAIADFYLVRCVNWCESCSKCNRHTPNMRDNNAKLLLFLKKFPISSTIIYHNSTNITRQRRQSVPDEPFDPIRWLAKFQYALNLDSDLPRQPFRLKSICLYVWRHLNIELSLTRTVDLRLNNLLSTI